MLPWVFFLRSLWANLESKYSQSSSWFSTYVPICSSPKISLACAVVFPNTMKKQKCYDAHFKLDYITSTNQFIRHKATSVEEICITIGYQTSNDKIFVTRAIDFLTIKYTNNSIPFKLWPENDRRLSRRGNKGMRSIYSAG